MHSFRPDYHRRSARRARAAEKSHLGVGRRRFAVVDRQSIELSVGAGRTRPSKRGPLGWAKFWASSQGTFAINLIVSLEHCSVETHTLLRASRRGFSANKHKQRRAHDTRDRRWRDGTNILGRDGEGLTGGRFHVTASISALGLSVRDKLDLLVKLAQSNRNCAYPLKDMRARIARSIVDGNAAIPCRLFPRCRVLPSAARTAASHAACARARHTRAQVAESGIPAEASAHTGRSEQPELRNSAKSGKPSRNPESEMSHLGDGGNSTKPL